MKLWDVAEGKLQTSWGASAGVLSLDFSPDGTDLVSATADSLVEIREVASGDKRVILREIAAPAQWVRFHRGGKRVLARTEQWMVLTQWRATTGEKLLRLDLDESQVDVECFCKQRSLIATRKEMRCDLVDLDTPLERAKLQTESDGGAREA